RSHRDASGCDLTGHRDAFAIRARRYDRLAVRDRARRARSQPLAVARTGNGCPRGTRRFEQISFWAVAPDPAFVRLASTRVLTASKHRLVAGHHCPGGLGHADAGSMVSD